MKQGRAGEKAGPRDPVSHEFDHLRKAMTGNILAGMAGLAVGGFLNVLITRLSQ